MNTTEKTRTYSARITFACAGGKAVAVVRGNDGGYHSFDWPADLPRPETYCEPVDAFTIPAEARSILEGRGLQTVALDTKFAEQRLCRAKGE